MGRGKEYAEGVRENKAKEETYELLLPLLLSPMTTRAPHRTVRRSECDGEWRLPGRGVRRAREILCRQIRVQGG
jgi:hypothetical protein